MNAIVEKEAKFIQEYTRRINYLKKEAPTGTVPYTKLSLPQAIIFYLVEINIIFHPLSLFYYSFKEKEPNLTKEDFVKVLEEIIQFESLSDRKDCRLTKEELEEAILCFRKLK